MTKFKVISKNLQKMAIWAKNPYFRPPRGSKSGKNEFSGKKRKCHVHSLILSFMQKNRKFYRAVFRENRVRERERQTDRQTERERERD